MPTSLRAIATKARERKDLRFFNLYRLIDENFLLECWRDIRKNAAYGVDGISARQYEENLMDNIGNLVERLKRKTYRARLVRRHWIPKPDGRQRPLGIPVVEDKLLQLAVTRILEAIYEQDFLRCSYGYRPNTGALDAVDKLTVKLQFGDYHFVVEADIQGFFDNLDQDTRRDVEPKDRRPTTAAVDSEMAQGRGAGYRRKGDAPADGDSPRRNCFADPGQCVSASRARSVVS